MSHNDYDDEIPIDNPKNLPRNIIVNPSTFIKQTKPPSRNNKSSIHQSDTPLNSHFSTKEETPTKLNQGITYTEEESHNQTHSSIDQHSNGSLSQISKYLGQRKLNYSSIYHQGIIFNDSFHLVPFHQTQNNFVYETVYKTNINRIEKFNERITAMKPPDDFNGTIATSKTNNSRNSNNSSQVMVSCCFFSQGK